MNPKIYSVKWFYVEINPYYVNATDTGVLYVYAYDSDAAKNAVEQYLQSQGYEEHDVPGTRTMKKIDTFATVHREVHDLDLDYQYDLIAY